jgi:hypothetical protein
MRSNLLPGLVLALAAGLLVLIGAALQLDLESVALLGGALGAIVALVPDRSPFVRLGGFAAGFVVAWVGYVLRAAMLPDTSTGRAVAVTAVVLLCVAVTGVARGRLPLWTLLLGTVGLTGAYEFSYAAAPPELLTTSVDTATTLFLSVAVGFCAAAVAGLAVKRHADPAPAPGSRRKPAPNDDTDRVPLTEMMETSK